MGRVTLISWFDETVHLFYCSFRIRIKKKRYLWKKQSRFWEFRPIQQQKKLTYAFHSLHLLLICSSYTIWDLKSYHLENTRHWFSPKWHSETLVKSQGVWTFVFGGLTLETSHHAFFHCRPCNQIKKKWKC